MNSGKGILVSGSDRLSLALYPRQAFHSYLLSSKGKSWIYLPFRMLFDFSMRCSDGKTYQQARVDYFYEVQPYINTFQ